MPGFQGLRGGFEAGARGEFRMVLAKPALRVSTPWRLSSSRQGPINGRLQTSTIIFPSCTQRGQCMHPISSGPSLSANIREEAIFSRYQSELHEPSAAGAKPTAAAEPPPPDPRRGPPFPTWVGVAAETWLAEWRGTGQGRQHKPLPREPYSGSGRSSPGGAPRLGPVIRPERGNAGLATIYGARARPHVPTETNSKYPWPRPMEGAWENILPASDAEPRFTIRPL